jgi:hypothetical protein
MPANKAFAPGDALQGALSGAIKNQRICNFCRMDPFNAPPDALSLAIMQALIANFVHIGTFQFSSLNPLFYDP